MFNRLNKILRPDGQYAPLDRPEVIAQLRDCDMLDVMEEYRQMNPSDHQAIDALLSCINQQESLEPAC